MRGTLVPETNIERDQLPKPAEAWNTGDLRPGCEAERGHHRVCATYRAMDRPPTTRLCATRSAGGRRWRSFA